MKPASADLALNPFPADPDRRAIWEILMKRDFEAFVAADWSMTEGDFLVSEFQGIDCARMADPDRWTMRFPDLISYQNEWCRQAVEFSKVEIPAPGKLPFLYRAVSLQQIDINETRAIAHKKFTGHTRTTTGAPIELSWQTLYLLRQINSSWKITGFVGYLPMPNL